MYRRFWFWYHITDSETNNTCISEVTTTLVAIRMRSHTLLLVSGSKTWLFYTPTRLTLNVVLKGFLKKCAMKRRLTTDLELLTVSHGSTECCANRNFVLGDTREQTTSASSGCPQTYYFFRTLTGGAGSLFSGCEQCCYRTFALMRKDASVA